MGSCSRDCLEHCQPSKCSLYRGEKAFHFLLEFHFLEGQLSKNLIACVFFGNWLFKCNVNFFYNVDTVPNIEIRS